MAPAVELRKVARAISPSTPSITDASWKRSALASRPRPPSEQQCSCHQDADEPGGAGRVPGTHGRPVQRGAGDPARDRPIDMARDDPVAGLAGSGDDRARDRPQISDMRRLRFCARIRPDQQPRPRYEPNAVRICRIDRAPGGAGGQPLGFPDAQRIRVPASGDRDQAYGVRFARSTPSEFANGARRCGNTGDGMVGRCSACEKGGFMSFAGHAPGLQKARRVASRKREQNRCVKRP